jgi:hypothetical protein
MGELVCLLPLQATPSSKLIPDGPGVGTLSYHMQGCFWIHMAQLTDGVSLPTMFENFVRGPQFILQD